MFRFFATIVVITVMFAVPAFSQEGGSKHRKQPGNIQVHGDSKPSERKSLVDILKSQKLANYPSTTIGAAFDNYRYFSKTEWKEYPVSNNKYYFDFTGILKSKPFEFLFNRDNINAQSLEVKFVIFPTNEFAVVMVSRIIQRPNGKIEKQPIDDMKGVLDKIYANQEIKF